MPYTCPVCGYPELTEPPRTADSGASYEICPSCGFQFGYDDDSEGIDYATWRRRWISDGMPWRSQNPAPTGWDAATQLRALEGGPSDRGESGQALVELGGLLILIAAIVGALWTIGIPRLIADNVGSSVVAIFGATASAHGDPGTGVSTTTGPAGPGTGAGAGPGGAAAAAGALAAVRYAAANAEQIIDRGGNGWGNPATLADHFGRHGPDFGSSDEDSYAREAQQFLQRAVDERLAMKVAPDGTIRVYDPSTNTFGAYNADGTTKSYFKPDLAKNPNYWTDQKGTDPWSEPAVGNPPGSEPGGSNGSGGSGGDSGGDSGGGSGSGGGNGSGGSGSGEPPVGGDPVPPEPPPELPPELPIIP